MAETPEPFPGHEVRVVRDEITIFSDQVTRSFVGEVEDGQKVAFISIGPGETRVNVIDDEGRSILTWVAVFGWSSLCGVGIEHRGETVRPANLSMLTKALRSSLRLYGDEVDTRGFVSRARSHMRRALSHILDQTVGDAREYDRIILAAPPWLHEALGDSLSIRPHIDPTIQEL